MQTERLFRVAAIAWLATAAARVGLAALGGGPSGIDSSVPALAIGAALGVVVAGLLWLRPGRGTAIAATLLGFYAVAGLAYLPIIGPQPWFLALSATGLVAFALSVACWIATRRDRGPG